MRRMAFIAPLVWGAASFGQASSEQPTDHPVISELRYRQHSGVNEEFVELYNPTSRTVSLHKWKLAYKKKTGGSWNVKVVFGRRQAMKPHGFFLWGGTAVSTPPDTADRLSTMISFTSLASTRAHRSATAFPSLATNGGSG